MRKSHHADDAELEFLLAGDEDSDEYRKAVAHVESCETCIERLEFKSGTIRLDDEAKELLTAYPWEELARSRAGEAPDVVGLEPQRAHQFDFLSPPSHPEMLGRLGRYEIERVIGSGGMGIVLKGFDTELNRPVAVKVLARHLAHSGAARKRFAREAKAAAAVVHEHVVAIHNVETESDVPFLVMQYVAGESLQARVDREGPLDPKEILRIGIQAAAGLAAAHEQGVVHRDVKPANILLEKGVERVLLTDFGLARTVDDASLTHTGVVAGTPHYMSPEQAGGAVTGPRTDLFSLGAVLYFMATGHPPFRAERAMGVLHRICYDRQRPVWEVNNDIPDELSDVIDRLLEKKPSRRFASAADAKDALSRLLAKCQQRGFRRRTRVARWLRRPAVTLGTLAVASTLAVLVLAPLAVSPQPEAQPPGAVTASDSAQPPEPIATFGGEFRAEQVAADGETAALEAQLEAIEWMSTGSRFAPPGDDAFEDDVASLDRLLDGLDGEVFPGFSTPQPIGGQR